MFNLEYYVGAFKVKLLKIMNVIGNHHECTFQDGGVWRTTKYTDLTEIPLSPETETIVWDRKLIYCVPV